MRDVRVDIGFLQAADFSCVDVDAEHPKNRSTYAVASQDTAERVRVTFLPGSMRDAEITLQLGRNDRSPSPR